MDILKRFRKLICREHKKKCHKGNIFEFSGTFYKNNALVIAYGKYVVFKIEEHSISLAPYKE